MTAEASNAITGTIIGSIPAPSGKRGDRGEGREKLRSVRLPSVIQADPMLLQLLISRSGFRFRVVWKSFETDAAPPQLRSGRCFEQQEEVRLEVGLDAVALGRNIDHGIGEREGEKGRARRGGQVGCLRALSSSSASLSTKAQGERGDEKGARGGRGTSRSVTTGPLLLHTHDGHIGCSLKEDLSFRKLSLSTF